MKRVHQIVLPILIAFGATLNVEKCCAISKWLGWGKSTKPSKVLHQCIPSKIKGMDPVGNNDLYTACQTAKVYEPLLTYAYTKSKLTLAPLLAESLPKVSEDGLTYTFTLKKGVKFQDHACFKAGKGREMVAQDWVYSFKRIADAKLNCPSYSFLTCIKGFEAFHKKAQQADKTDYTQDIAGIKALDKYTLRISLYRPCAQLLSILTMDFTSVVPKEAVDYYGAEFNNHAVGTGPFCLKEYRPMGLKIVFEKNPNYRDEYFPTDIDPEFKHMVPYAGKKLPFVSKIVVHILTVDTTAYLKFMQGKLDINKYPPSDVVATSITRQGMPTGELAKKHVQVMEREGAALFLMYFNLQHPLLKNNASLRKAMSLAFDRKRMLQLVLDGRGTIAQSIIPPGLQGYDPDYINPNTVYNLDKAKKLLSQAGYPEGEGLPQITLHIPSGKAFYKKLAEVFQACMRDIGVKIKIIQISFSDLISIVKKEGDTSTMLFCFAWGADYADAENFLQLLYGKNKGTNNSSWYDNAEYNRLYEKAMRMPDCPARTRLYIKMNKIAARDMPAIFLYTPTSYVLVHDWVRNCRFTEFHYGTEKYIDVDEKQRAAS